MVIDISGFNSKFNAKNGVSNIDLFLHFNAIIDIIQD